MTIDKAELRRLAEAATPGPWHSPGLGEIHMPSHDSVAQVCFKHDLADDDEVFGTQADADFISAVNPLTIIALLDQLDAKEREIEGLRKDAERFRHLRKHHYRMTTANSDGPSHPYLSFGFDGFAQNPNSHSADGLNSAIDAAIASEQEKGKG